MATTHTFRGTDYRWRLAREHVDEVLHYSHWIPNTRGFTRQFFDEHYPGENLSGFLAVFRASDILLDDGLGSELVGRCHWKVRYVYFTDANSWAVEWDDTITEDDGNYFYTGCRTDHSPGRGSFTGSFADVIDDPEALTDRVMEMLEQVFGRT